MGYLLVVYQMSDWEKSREGLEIFGEKIPCHWGVRYENPREKKKREKNRKLRYS